MATPQEVAQWMSQQLDAQQVLSQKYAAVSIESMFGNEHVYANRNGNRAIVKRAGRIQTAAS